MVLLLAGLVLSLIGSLPPGLISLSVAQTAIARGFKPAVALGSGAAFAEFFQAWIAVEMAGWFLQHPSIERYFEWGAILVFGGLSIYLFFWSRPPVESTHVKANPAWFPMFFKGILLSVFNLLAIPYWFTYCGWLRLEGWWQGTGFWPVLAFGMGVVLGTWIVLILYARLGSEIIRRSDVLARKANRIVALIFFGLGLKMAMAVFGIS
jgi:threonine/homoserine/homoserine lactone efflux protein